MSINIPCSDLMAEFRNLLPTSWEKVILEWLREDIPSFDYGGFVVGSKHETATLYGKSPGILAGIPFVDEIFKQLECNANHFVQLKEKFKYKGIIAGTRKTTPGFRLVEKYALLVGGVDCHRMDLSSMIMLKDNHIWSFGSITKAVESARKVGGFSLKVHVEVQSEAEAEEAILANADIVMLDNFEPWKMKLAVTSLKCKYPNAVLEASGGITLDNIEKYFESHVDIISSGGLTQGVKHLDFSLKINKTAKNSF